MLLKTYEMTRIIHAYNNMWFGTCQNVNDSKFRCICFKSLLEYFYIPIDTKKIWLNIYSKPTKNSYCVRHDNKLTIKVGQDMIVEQIDHDIIKDFKQYTKVYVEVQY